ncbi:putative 2-dehydropantoate 2-reductase [Madurella mycetomatis]|uniref:2-dehydropantoate 2-reductase n=1 Tax=Madurella mycetomatis TaxID=100816 RepID=A0A175WAX2_9PEZI|nr:putative 2-dehydropantoate 2-reductase [Madurella mycetomatis]
MKSAYVPWTPRRTILEHRRTTPGPFTVPPPTGLTSPIASASSPPEPPISRYQPEKDGDLEEEIADNREVSEEPEPERIRSKIALWDSEERQARAPPPVLTGMQPFRPSDQIYVMGLDLVGRYITHALAGCETIPPVRYLLHSRQLCNKWVQANGRLTLHRGRDIIVRRGVQAEDITEQAQYPADDDDIIHNLIVTVPAGQVVQALERIRHRLDHRSTICLVNDGLGVAEALIEAYFPVESRRPIFLLGHFSTHLGHTKARFSVSEVRQGRLYLTLLSPQAPGPGMPFQIKRHPPLERTARATHLIRLLTAMPGLHATGHPLADFFKRKLPTVAFRSIVDPIAVLLDTTYDKLPSNPYARQLMERLLGEVSRVVSSLPELRDSREFRQSVVDSTLRKEVFRKLMLQRTADSKMRAHTARGWDTDVDFLSGYFIRRGRQLRLNITALDSVMWAVKAKKLVVQKKLAAELPMDDAAMMSE